MKDNKKGSKDIKDVKDQSTAIVSKTKETSAPEKSSKKDKKNKEASKEALKTKDNKQTKDQAEKAVRDTMYIYKEGMTKAEKKKFRAECRRKLNSWENQIQKLEAGTDKDKESKIKAIKKEMKAFRTENYKPEIKE
jgi:hypothetical protein